jgi:hypothetical protein
MSKVKFAAMVSVSICIAAFAIAQSQGADELPPGPMQNKARTACTTCHDAHIIVQQRLSKAAWGKEVDKMTKWGAIVDAADRDALVDYFSANFSPDKPAYTAQKSARSR